MLFNLDKVVSSGMIDQLLTEAEQSPRKRIHRELHERGEESPIQWFLNVITPGSFVSPHFHPEEGKWEWFQILRGKVAVFLFDKKGVITHRRELTPDNCSGVEIPPQAWHTIVALEPSALLELKSGPYNPSNDKIFAAWAPRENEPLSTSCEQWYRTAGVGDTFALTE